ncbi:MAG: hypothetical protein Q9162_003000 [Coniocarpon cinnabarinum]
MVTPPGWRATIQFKAFTFSSERGGHVKHLEVKEHVEEVQLWAWLFWTEARSPNGQTSQKNTECLKSIVEGKASVEQQEHITNIKPACIVLFHGNCYDMAAKGRHPHYKAILDELQANGEPGRLYLLLTIDYPGFGLVEGHPGQPAICQAGRATVNYVRDELKVKPGSIFCMGHSIGTGVAALTYEYFLSEKVALGALFLVSAFTSTENVVPTFRLYNIPVAGLASDVDRDELMQWDPWLIADTLENIGKGNYGMAWRVILTHERGGHSIPSKYSVELFEKLMESHPPIERPSPPFEHDHKPHRASWSQGARATLLLTHDTSHQEAPAQPSIVKELVKLLVDGSSYPK